MVCPAGLKPARRTNRDIDSPTLTIDTFIYPWIVTRSIEMRRSIVIAAACGALTITAAAPADAETLASQDVAKAYSIMMTSGEGKSLVGGKKMVRAFSVLSADSGPADSPWLCDLSGSDEIEGKGGGDVVTVEFVSEKGPNMSEALQEVFVYSTAQQAKLAYDRIVKDIKQCEGLHRPTANDGEPAETDDASGSTRKLTNGTKTFADGDTFLWVNSTTTIASTGGNLQHDYRTVRHFGPYLQILQVESEGTSAPKISAQQIRTMDRLTDSLGDRWRSALN
jgi:hypothetical protein